MLVTCEERVWDGKRCRIYNIGDQADIDPLSPLAKYFEGWPPGTEVYTKIKGVEGMRVVPGLIPKIKVSEETPDDREEDDTPRPRGRPKGS